MMNIKQPQNTMEAVTLGLFLSLTAPTDQQSQQASEMVESMAGGLSLNEVEEAKTEALKMAQEHWECSSMSKTTFLEFTKSEAERMWHGDHLKKSLRKAEKFAEFSDHSTRALSDYKPSDIHAFFDHLSAQRLSDNTVNHYAAMLTKCFKQAVKAEVIEHAPEFTWRRVVASQRPLYYTQDQLTEIERWFAHSDQPWIEHFVIIGHQTGMRLGEICKINRSTVTTDDNGHSWIYLDTTKNGSDRFVPANKRTMKAIEALDYDCGHHFDEKKFYSTWKRMRRAVLKGNKNYVFHTLRHTAATVMANDLHANTTVIGLLLGHRSEKTTNKYIKAKPKALQALAAQMALMN